MLDQLDELYRDVILDHFKASAHRGEAPGASFRAEGHNPLCGDDLTFTATMKDGRFGQVRFTGKGCAISQATASMFSAQLEGKTVEQTGRLIRAMKALMQGETLEASVDLGDLEALAGVRKFPVRIKCAALSWNAIEQGLQNLHQSRAEGSRP